MTHEKLTALPGNLRNAYRGWNVKRRAAHFAGWLDRRVRSNADGSGYDHTETVNNYYDLFSDFMQYGWGESLHFAPLTPEETLEESIVRHQRLMIEKLELREGMRIVDVGCGVGGPMRRIARESGARVVCVNNNEQQLETARRRNIEAGLDHLAEYIKCSFMDMGVIEANSLDGALAIESTCHAPDKEHAFAEIFRVLKPGALFWGQEMCMTDRFDPGSSNHLAIKDQLMQGVALNDIATFAEVNRALEAAGFQILEALDRDIKDGPSTPWYRPMEIQKGTLSNKLRRTPLGRKMMLAGIRLTAVFGLFPKGSESVMELLDRIADAYVAGGKTGIFSPLYCFLARKPA